MTDWTRVPVVVGAGQVTNREEDPAFAPDPFELMQEAAELAATSAGRVGIPTSLTHVWMVHSLSVRHGDPAGFLADRIGAGGAQSRCSGMGGSVPQWLVDRAAEIVCEGGRPQVLIVGAEALATRKRARREGVDLDWPKGPGFPDTWPPIEPDLGVHEVERAHGLAQATAMYALVETALAHAKAEDPVAHRQAMGDLMASFNEVAVRNPFSWFGEARSAEELTTVTPENRMIYYPYPKYMNAVMDVDMSAALVVTDAATAREWGLASDEVAYVAGWADAHDIWYLSERPRVEHSEALAVCARAALDAAGIHLSDVSAFDLYSCFPSSVEVARDSIGLAPEDPRPLTITGGLPYHGGPGSNYVTHAIANALEWLRSGAGDSVLVQGNGYYLTKHAVGIYTRRPPEDQPRAPEKVQEISDGRSSPVRVDATAEGPGAVAAYTAPFTREGVPESAVVLVDLDGCRTVASADESLTSLLVGDAKDDRVGVKVVVSRAEGGNTARAGS